MLWHTYTQPEEDAVDTEIDDGFDCIETQARDVPPGIATVRWMSKWNNKNKRHCKVVLRIYSRKNILPWKMTSSMRNSTSPWRRLSISTQPMAVLRHQKCAGLLCHPFGRLYSPMWSRAHRRVYRSGCDAESTGMHSTGLHTGHAGQHDGATPLRG